MNLNNYVQLCHTANQKWWEDPLTQQPIKRNKGELISLVHSEISECFDGESQNLMDDKLPHRKMGEVELVDAQIRLFDYAAGFNYDLNEAGLKIGISAFINLDHLGKCAYISINDKHKLYENGLNYIHYHISRLLEHERKGRQIDANEAIINCLVFISLYGNFKGYDLQGAFEEKMEFNRTRDDHKHEVRLIAGGKQF